MYQYAAQIKHSSANFRLRYRIMLIAVIILMITTVVFGIMALNGSSLGSRTHGTFLQAMSNNAASAISVANRLDSTSNSTASQRLGVIRQYVYGMEQINRISIQLFGEQGGRFVPDVGFTSLYKDLDDYEELVQSAKNSTVEIRERMINHLKLVQGYINGDLVS